MSLKDLLSKTANDTVTLVKQAGARTEGVRAVVESDQITTYDTSLDVEEGDKIERLLPTGRAESYLVLDTGYQPGYGPVPPFYQMKVRKVSAISESQRGASVVYNVSGPNARVNVNSTDSSTNITNVSPDELFSEMQNVVEGIQDSERRELLVKRIKALEQSQGSGDFAQRYKEFVSVAADHFSLFAPFMPALEQLLGP